MVAVPAEMCGSAAERIQDLLVRFLEELFVHASGDVRAGVLADHDPALVEQTVVPCVFAAAEGELLLPKLHVTDKGVGHDFDEIVDLILFLQKHQVKIASHDRFHQRAGSLCVRLVDVQIFVQLRIAFEQLIHVVGRVDGPLAQAAAHIRLDPAPEILIDLQDLIPLQMDRSGQGVLLTGQKPHLTAKHARDEADSEIGTEGQKLAAAGRKLIIRAQQLLVQHHVVILEGIVKIDRLPFHLTGRRNTLRFEIAHVLHLPVRKPIVIGEQTLLLLVIQTVFQVFQIFMDIHVFSLPFSPAALGKPSGLTKRQPFVFAPDAIVR